MFDDIWKSVGAFGSDPSEEISIFLCGGSTLDVFRMILRLKLPTLEEA